MFELTFATDSAAFGPEEHHRNVEVARILRKLADRIEKAGTAPSAIFDENGNRVGAFEMADFNPRDHMAPVDTSDVEEISGTYGSGHTPCTIYTYPAGNGAVWYAVEGSHNVNQADGNEIVDGVDVETVCDWDTFTASNPINDADDMARECQEV